MARTRTRSGATRVTPGIRRQLFETVTNILLLNRNPNACSCKSSGHSECIGYLSHAINMRSRCSEGMDSKLASDGNFTTVDILSLSPRSRATKDHILAALQIPKLLRLWHGTLYDVHLCASCMIVYNDVSTLSRIILHESVVFSIVSDYSCHFTMVCVEVLTWLTRAAYVAPKCLRLPLVTEKTKRTCMQNFTPLAKRRKPKK